MIKQNINSTWAIGGKPTEIEPLFISLFNYGRIPLGAELLDVGNPDDFQYFTISEKDFINGRTMAFSNALFINDQAVDSSRWKGVKGGSRAHYLNKSIEEFLAIPEETFIFEHKSYNSPFKAAGLLELLDKIGLAIEDGN